MPKTRESPGEWVTLDSSNIQQVKYDPRMRMLTVQFHGKSNDGTGEYIYHGVPQGTFDGLCGAESPGKFFHRYINKKFKTYRGIEP